MDCLLNMVSGLSVRGDANSLAEALADGISAACNASMARPHAEHPGSLILQDDEIVATNSEEVLITTAKVKAGKAPGPYGIPNGVLKTIIATHPEVFACLFNQCLKEGTEREIGAGLNNSLPPGNLVATMLASEHGWAAISNMASNIMKELRRRERSRATSLLAYIRPREGADR
ncbi:hypothetical protein ACLKA6_002988 [Drosophila palustris]